MSFPVFMVPDGDTLPVLFNTYDGGSGASITMTGLAVTDVEIYKDGSITQRASDAGIALIDTDGIDIDGVTGLHGFTIDLSDNTDAGFYTVGSWFHVHVASVTVDAQTVNFIACAFRIMASEGVAGVPEVDLTHVNAAATTATLDTIKAETALIVADTDVIDDATSGLVKIATDVAAILNDTDLIDDATSGLAKIATDVAAVLVDTAVIGAAGAGLTAVPWNAAWDAEAQSEVNDALVAFFTSAAQLVDDIWDEVLTGAAHNVATSAGKRLRSIDAAFEVSSGTAQAGAATTITLAAGESAVDNIFRGDRVTITAGTGIGEHGIITAYNGTTKVATVAEAWVTTPDATSEYTLVPASIDVETWQHTVVTSSATTALPEVDAKSLSDDATAADNAELFFDGTGYAGTNNVIPSVTTVTGNVDGSVGSNIELGPAEVNAEVVDALTVDTLTATPQAAPPTTPTLEEALMVLYDALVHKVDVTATAKEFSNNAGTVIWKKALSDDATNYIEAESVTGP